MLNDDDIDNVLALFDKEDLIYLKIIFENKKETLNEEKPKENMKKFRSIYDRQRK